MNMSRATSNGGWTWWLAKPSTSGDGHALVSIHLLGVGDAELVTSCTWRDYQIDQKMSIEEARSEWRRLRADGWRPYDITKGEML
jgi:hypothetical protein